MELKPQILVLDDDFHFYSTLKHVFGLNFGMHSADNLAKAVDVLSREQIGCILLDYNLGRETGLQVLDGIREIKSEVPIIVVSGQVSLDMAKGFLNRRITAFLEKPVSLDELKEKILAVLPKDQPNSQWGFDLDFERREVKWQGDVVGLTRLEYRLLILFVKRAGERITRDEVTLEVWGKVHQSRNNLDTHLGNLRKKLPPFAERLQAAYGEGFRFEA